jgi:hypothetical protein
MRYLSSVADNFEGWMLYAMRKPPTFLWMIPQIVNTELSMPDPKLFILGMTPPPLIFR